MKHQLTHHLIAALLGVVFTAELHAQTTAFTYQGRLDDAGAFANGVYDFQYGIYDGPTGTNGNYLSGDEIQDVAVTNGLFTLNLLAEHWVFNGQPRWLGLEVRTNGPGEYTKLEPWTEITPTPYAVRALTVTSNALDGGYEGIASFSHPSNTFVGTFTGDGGALSNVAATTLGGLASSNFWQLGGNAGTTPGTQFLGTTDNQALEFKVNGLRALRLEDNGDGRDGGADPDGAPNVIGGSPFNFVAAGVVGATIAGGGSTNYGSAYNAVMSEHGTVGGGWGNRVWAGSDASTIAGGSSNDIGLGSGLNADNSTIGGGLDNNIAADAGVSTIAGGWGNNIGTNNVASTIGGGASNDIGDTSGRSTIAGGQGNSIVAGAGYAMIPGGMSNQVAGAYGFAAGRRAKANHTGAFVWADSQNADFASTADNQFLIRASGGVGIGTESPKADLHLSSAGSLTLWLEADSDNSVESDQPSITLSQDGGIITGEIGLFDSQNHLAIRTLDTGGSVSHLLLEPEGNVGIGTNKPSQKLHVAGNILATGTVTGSSDRNIKENFMAIDPQSVLNKVVAMPIQRWNYIGEEIPHLGPVAQDFHGAFQVGLDDKHISMVDADGVALAAIQGLNQKVESGKQKAEIRMEKLEAENAELKQTVSELKELVETMNRQRSGGAK